MAYPLKTPHIAFLSFIFIFLSFFIGRFTDKAHNARFSMERLNEHFLTSRLLPLTYDLDIWTWPRYPSTWLDVHAKIQVYMSVCSARIARRTHIQTDTQTHDVKTITPITSETWGVKMCQNVMPCCVVKILDECSNLRSQVTWLGEYISTFN